MCYNGLPAHFRGRQPISKLGDIMEHAKLDLTPTQRMNLAILATYLDALPEGYEYFDMEAHYYHSDKGYEEPIDVFTEKSKMQCGTSACAAGHGIDAGIKPLPSEREWPQYVERCFCPVDSGQTFIWLFSEDWCEVDNTPSAASKRIFYALQHGVPENFEEIMYNKVPFGTQMDV